MRPFWDKSNKKPKLPKTRDLQTIRAEYEKVAQQAGSLQYTIKVQELELEQLNKRIYDLNQEAHRASQLAREEVMAKVEEGKKKEEANKGA